MNTVPPLDITDLPDAIIAMSSHVCLLAAKSSRKNTSNWSLYKNSTGMELPIKPGKGGGLPTCWGGGCLSENFNGTPRGAILGVA